MPQPITDYAAFFGEAKQAVQDLDELKQKEKMLLDLEKQLESSLKTKQKNVSETIALTVKKRRDEIAKSYDAEIAKTQERLKKVRSKREKAKSQGEKERIVDETQSLMKENDELRSQIKTLFRANHVPRYCVSDLYYSLYFTKGLKELLTMLVTILICFLAIPCGIYFLLPEQKTLYLIIIYVVTILLFGGLYVKIGNSTKMKHMEVLKEGRNIRNQIVSNKKQMKAITKSIRKDKDEAVYNLQKFDDEITQLEQDKAQAERQKKEALNTFETVTKTIISDEIMGNHKAELDQMASDLTKTEADLKATQSAAMAKALYITDNYEIYAGKEFMTLDKLQALQDIIESGKATNITDAIINYKGKDYNKKSSN
ncbi:MAG: hypothetical protein IJ374_03405 [Lachnospiraceae bacterium]|nr:hypothetical protein [Lachnospiraceae bacterium]